MSNSIENNINDLDLVQNNYYLVLYIIIIIVIFCSIKLISYYTCNI